MDEAVVKVKKRMGRRTNAEVDAIRKEAGLPPIKRLGRPPKLAIVSNSDKGRQQELLAGLLRSKGKRIIEQIISKALDPDDKDQMACMKMCVDRILPLGYFEKAKDSGNKGVTIQIMGVGAEPVVINAVEQAPMLDIVDATEDEE